MTRYTIELKASAAKALAALPRRDQVRVGDKIDALAIEPRPYGAKALRGEPGLLRVRVGDYRVIYSVEDNVLHVLVVRVAHRREAYR